MKRSTTSFVCQECGYDSPQWLGKCPECNNWNSLKEFQLNSKFSARGGSASGRKNQVELKPRTLLEIEYTEKQRLLTGFSEMDTVLGGGIVAGSVTLLAGDPGIGKSTLLLQVGLNISNGSNKVVLNKAKDPIGQQEAKKKEILRGVYTELVERAQNDNSSVLYISGEESEEQVKLRAVRISKNDKINKFLLLAESNVDSIVEVIRQTNPKLVIVDSIQTMESEAAGGLSGSISQIRYAASVLIKTAKTLSVPIILVGHVTKEGMVAGPMILSHMVDCVLFLEGEKGATIRILRSFKNRFGPIDEVGIFTMAQEGLKEVKNPEQIFLSEKRINASGSILVCTLEGTRTFLVEIQGLTVFSKMPYPRRVSSGVDPKRLELLLAIAQKHIRMPLDTMDVFINVAGGIRLLDPAIDLGVCLSLFSSLKNVPLAKTVAIAEVGLLGELRPVGFLDKRIKEAKKLGFKHIISSQTHRTLGEVIKSLG